MADKNNTTISLCVDKVLDHVGASEQIRRNHVEKGLIDEVIMNKWTSILHRTDFRWHNVGSWCEGTTTKGMGSDMDKLMYKADFQAVEQIPGGFELGCLIINDGTTKPGYVKLQYVIDGIPLTSNSVAPYYGDTDQFGRVVFCNNKIWTIVKELLCTIELRELFTFVGFLDERRGPAITMARFYEPRELDVVYAFRCYSIPSFVNGWIHRPRNYGWPSKQQLNNMSTYGCFLVGKGHPSSQTQHLEWRISFSFQERELMFSLNSTQHKCYVLLKIVKQALVSKMNEKSISSYHLKTALFYTKENNPAHIWIPDNLVYCTELCLKQLLGWLNNENCPNFFVPEENMFDRLSRDVMEKTAKYIRDMLDSDGQYLMLLTCDKFGELLQESLSGRVLANLSLDAIKFDLKCKTHISMFSIFLANRLAFLVKKTNVSDPRIAFISLFKELTESIETMDSEGMLREIGHGCDLFSPTLFLHFAQTMVAMMLTVTGAEEKRMLGQLFENNIEDAEGVDIMSQKLIKASLLFKQNKLEECERILTDCETSLKDCVISICPCTSMYNIHYKLKTVIENGYTSCIPLLEFKRTFITSCLIFLPFQINLVPTPLLFEMYRSVGADTGYILKEIHYWFDVISIDAKLYLFFLQYIVYSKLNKHKLAEGAISNLTRILFESTNTRLTLGHRETGFNLLGWIFKRERNIEFAAICFWISWQIRPDHNAAKWHMLVMMYEQYVQRCVVW